jgi:hypothetical protein
VPGFAVWGTVTHDKVGCAEGDRACEGVVGWVLMACHIRTVTLCGMMKS